MSKMTAGGNVQNVPKKWSGTWPANCQVCRTPNLSDKGADLSFYDWFVDGLTRYGHWALMCPECFDQEGVGLGTGLGQKYDSKTLVKLEG